LQLSEWNRSKQKPEISLAIVVDSNIVFSKFCLCEEFNFEHQL